MTPAERERERRRRLKGNPVFEAKRKANYTKQNKRRRADPEIAQRMREANRKRMAALRADDSYRKASVAKVKALRAKRRLDAEFEHYMQKLEQP
jgi:hypothetical protein